MKSLHTNNQLNVNENGLNSATERHRMPEWIFKNEKTNEQTDNKHKTQLYAAYKRLTSASRTCIGLQ